MRRIPREGSIEPVYAEEEIAPSCMAAGGPSTVGVA
jgi:hypothetical protein